MKRNLKNIGMYLVVLLGCSHLAAAHPTDMRFKEENGFKWQIINDTEYPADGAVDITINPEEPIEKRLYFRIPEWSRNTKVRIVSQGKTVDMDAVAGTYLPIKRVWRKGDRIKLGLDMDIYYLHGDKYVEGKTSIYRGPVLLAWDQSRNEHDFNKFPVLDVKSMSARIVGEQDMNHADKRFKPVVLIEVEGVGEDGQNIKARLCDFASVGALGSVYRSWLPVNGSGSMAVAPEPYKDEQTEHKPFFHTDLRGPIRSQTLTW